jgi:hypothetical protein
MLNENEAGFIVFAWHTVEGIFEIIIKKKKLPPLALLASPGGLGTETLIGVGKSQLWLQQILITKPQLHGPRGLLKSPGQAWHIVHTASTHAYTT